MKLEFDEVFIEESDNEHTEIFEDQTIPNKESKTAALIRDVIANTTPGISEAESDTNKISDISLDTLDSNLQESNDKTSYIDTTIGILSKFKGITWEKLKSTKQFMCKICKSSYKNNSTLKTHISTIHEGNKPFQCYICKQEFGQKASLNQHMLNHEGKKPFECHVCKKQFAQSNNLKIHITRYHEG